MVIPTIFAISEEAFKHRFDVLVGIAKNLQIDLMDGKFVSGKSIGIEHLSNLKKYKTKFEAHIMVKNPIDWVDKIKSLGFKKIIFHVEADPKRITETISKIKKESMEAWLAVNPETSISAVIPHIHSISGILLMGVEPGKEHQDFNKIVYEKIKEIRTFKREIKIQVDGGVNEEVAKKLRDSGVDIINTGSFVAHSENPKKALKKLESAFL